MSPDALRAAGATSHGTGVPTREDHFFVCIDVIGDDSYWIGASSKFEFGRLPLAIDEKKGHPKWVNTPTFAVVTSVWRCSTRAVELASRAAGDCSRWEAVGNSVTMAALVQLGDAAEPALCAAQTWRQAI